MLSHKLLLSVFLLVSSAVAHPQNEYEYEYGLSSCSCADDVTRFAPIPEQALGVDVEASGVGYVTEDLGDGAYVVYSSTHNAMFLVTGEGVIVVDNPPSIGINMQYAIGNVTDEPVKKVIYSHAHYDHIGAAGIFASDEIVNTNTSSSTNGTTDAVEFIAHADTEFILRAISPQPEDYPPLPTTTFTGNTTVTLGNQTVELAYFGPNHQTGNIFIYVTSTASKILMFIDVIFPGWVPPIDLALAEFVPGFINAHDTVLAYDFDVFIGGHFFRVGDRSDAEASREYVRDLEASCRQVIEEQDAEIQAAKADVAEQNPNNPPAFVVAVNQRVAEVCAEPVQEKWLGRLAGVDAFVLSSALTMVFSLRIDYGLL